MKSQFFIISQGPVETLHATSKVKYFLESDTTNQYYENMNTLNYKGYTAKVEFEPDDNILFGNIIGIRDTVGFHGESVNELKEAFHEAVDLYQESIEK